MSSEAAVAMNEPRGGRFFSRFFRSRSNQPVPEIAPMEQVTAMEWLSAENRPAENSVRAPEDDMLAKSTVKLEAILLTVNLIRSPIKVELVEGRWNIFCYTDGLSPYRVEVWQDNKLKHSMEQKEGLATECRMSFPADFEDDTCCLRLCILLRSAQDQNPIIAEGRMVAGIQATNLIIHKGREKGTHEAKIEQQRLLLPGYEMDLFEIFGQPHSIINVEQKAEGSSSLGSQAYFSASNSDLPGFNRECVICLSQRRDTLFLPCRHMCLCLPCAESLCHQSDKCPICRQEFRSMLNINSL